MFQKSVLKPLLFLAILSISWSACTQSAASENDKTWKLVVYNVENLFDADGVAVFSDYQPAVYTPAHIFNKIDNMARLMARYNNGLGPDILVLSEVESDFTNPRPGTTRDVDAFLQRWGHTTLQDMLLVHFDDEIADLPSELLLIKGLHDRGLTGYDVSVAYGPLNEDGTPTHVQKNVTLSRLPIMHEKTRVHPIETARPILETWIDVEGYPLVVFGNHWRARASDPDFELIRIQNATVLRQRLDELRAENPRVDFILGGDFNSDYNQSYRYTYMEKTAVNDVLQSTGNELAVAGGHPEKVYNLWHEIPVDERGSDTFRGYWGTLMQIMISPGLYDFYGVQYVDNSFEVGRFIGKNVYPTSMTPVRWNGFGEGRGYSDHLPISMRFRVVSDKDTSRVKDLTNPGFTDNAYWSPIPVQTRMPEEGEYFIASEIDGSIRTTDYFDELFLVEAVIDNRARVTVNGERYDLFAPAFNVREYFADKAGETVRFYGRLGMFRGNWQFVIESEDYIL
ncbi:MAG: endonuclease/exonuclease/phosphatase family protein [Bacteroidetes bacterium]|nr:endonuclease/exonuclease/phosphatase family protein [Bacteroidota bacterium]MCH8522912.1 endonuclease/exonuclease/phosphatase family protein [Balneolales bacterium]